VWCGPERVRPALRRLWATCETPFPLPDGSHAGEWSGIAGVPVEGSSPTNALAPVLSCAVDSRLGRGGTGPAALRGHLHSAQYVSAQMREQRRTRTSLTGRGTEAPLGFPVVDGEEVAWGMLCAAVPLCGGHRHVRGGHVFRSAVCCAVHDGVPGAVPADSPAAPGVHETDGDDAGCCCGHCT